jgi:hypothetical protein
MKATFNCFKPVYETITIPEQFEFIYDGTVGEDDYTQEQYDLYVRWHTEVLPKMLGPQATDIECWWVFPDD